MKFLTLSLHVTICHDAACTLRALGHTVDELCLSDHCWVLGRERSALDVFNRETWTGIDAEMCRAFHDRYREEFAGYDAFVVAHPVAAALLFEQWRKPVVAIASTRYDYPCESRRRWLNDGLACMLADGRLIPIANDAYDRSYADRWSDIRWDLLPSLCEYTGETWTGGGRWLLWSRPRWSLSHPRLSPLTLPGDVHPWSAIARAAGIVHVPYNVSLVSAFEQAAMGCPMLVPTPRYLRELAGRGEALGELRFPNSADAPDDWLNLADWYSWPWVRQFDSREDLAVLLDSYDGAADHERWRAWFTGRKAQVYNGWTAICERLAA